MPAGDTSSASAKRDGNSFDHHASDNVFTNTDRKASSKIEDLANAGDTEELKVEVEKLEASAHFAAEGVDRAIEIRLFLSRQLRENYEFNAADHQMVLAVQLVRNATRPAESNLAVLIEAFSTSMRRPLTRSQYQKLLPALESIENAPDDQLTGAAKLLNQQKSDVLSDLAEFAQTLERYDSAAALSTRHLKTCPTEVALQPTCRARALHSRSKASIRQHPQAAEKDLNESIAALRTVSGVDSSISLRISFPLTISREAYASGNLALSEIALAMAEEEAIVVSKTAVDDKVSKTIASHWVNIGKQYQSTGHSSKAVSTWQRAHKYATETNQANQQIALAIAIANELLRTGTTEDANSWLLRASDKAVLARLSRKEIEKFSKEMERIAEFRDALASDGSSTFGARAGSTFMDEDLLRLQSGQDFESWAKRVSFFPISLKADGVQRILRRHQERLHVVTTTDLVQFTNYAAAREAERGQEDVSQRLSHEVIRLTETRSDQLTLVVRASAFSRLAQFALVKGNLSSAEDFFTAAGKLHPDQHLNLYGLALTYHLAGRPLDLAKTLNKLETLKIGRPHSITRDLLVGILKAKQARKAQSTAAGITEAERVLQPIAVLQNPRLRTDLYHDAFFAASELAAPNRDKPANTELLNAMAGLLNEVSSGYRDLCDSDATKAAMSFEALEHARSAINHSRSSWYLDGTTAAIDSFGSAQLEQENLEIASELALRAHKQGQVDAARRMYALAQNKIQASIEAIPTPPSVSRPADREGVRIKASQMERLYVSATPEMRTKMLKGSWFTVNWEPLRFGASFGLKEYDPQGTQLLPQQIIQLIPGRLTYSNGKCDTGNRNVKQILSFAVKKGDLADVQIVGRADDLSKDRENLLAAVRSKSPVDLIYKESRRLFDILLRQHVELVFSRDEDIFIAPSGEMAAMPFGLLIRSVGRANPHVIIPSAGLYSSLSSKKPSINQSVVFADPEYGEPAPGGNFHNQLSYAGEEGKTVASMLDGELAVGRKASLARLLNVKSPMVVHFATHSYIENNFRVQVDANLAEIGLADAAVAVMSARIALSHANEGQGGIAHAGVISGFLFSALELGGTRMVVFSSCDSAMVAGGLGNTANGLQLSAHLAGAKTVLATLWKVDDQGSQQAMTRFYSELKQKFTPSIALRKAQDALASDPAFSHPFYWAGYTLSGINSPIFQ